MHPCLIVEYLSMVQEWMDSFPPQLDAHNPNPSLDSAHEWIPLHRDILQCAGYQMMLRFFRPYLSRSVNLQPPHFEIRLRTKGVDYGLAFLRSLIALLNRIRPGDVSLQPTLFSLFDVCVTLCAAVLRDGDDGLRKGNDIRIAVQENVAVLVKLADKSWTAQRLLKSLHALHMPSMWLPPAQPLWRDPAMRRGMLA